jgi:putative transposase
MKIEPIVEGNYYHIYNRGINGTNIFKEKDNYRHFMHLYEKYIEPVTDTYAWCLIPNHFHLLVRIKGLEEIKDLSGFQNPKGLEAKENKNFIITNQFSKFFNAYAKAFNNRFKRTGSLFEKPFERKRVNGMDYFKELIYYIHYNPVHHRFCKRLEDYPWSSYGSVISLKPTKLNRDAIIGRFDSIGNFIDYHKQKRDFNDLKDLLFD